MEQIEGSHNSKVWQKVFIGIIVLVVLFFAGKSVIGFYYLKTGEKLINDGNFTLAEKKLITSLSFASNPLAYAHLGRAALGEADPNAPELYPEASKEKAIEYYEQSISHGIQKASPEVHAVVLNRLSLLYFIKGEHDKAEKYSQEVITLYPSESLWPRFRLAYIYFTKLDKPKEALELLLPAENLVKSGLDEKKFYLVQILFARLYRYFDNDEEAEKYATLAINKAGLSGETTELEIPYNILAVLAGKKKDFTAAKNFIEKSNSYAEGGLKYDCVLALAYYQGEDYSSAISVGKDALNKPASNSARSVCLLTLGDSYIKRGLPDEAKKYFTQYIKTTVSSNSLEVKGIKHAEEELSRL
ncbi:MAG: tetratricopeptide repeat protein [Candidatus Sungbacteria bacterium]|nr:tetratricopeptide repeat protein [Candidatus Sungbacteria bacterium]